MIQIADKYFEHYISEEQVQSRVAELAKKISEEYKMLTPYLLIVLNGSLRFAADLLKHWEGTVEMGCTKVSSYQATERGHLTCELEPTTLEGRNVLIIEDIVESGKTLQYLLGHPQIKKAQSVKIVALLNKPTAHQVEVVVDYTGFEIENQFVIGYGLDYQGLGRNLNAIYQLKKQT